MNKNEHRIKETIIQVGILLDIVEDSPNLSSIRNHIDSTLGEIAKFLEKDGTYTTDEKLRVFDDAFRDGGWENMGYRWHNGEILYGDIS
jgi:hypothetical protein